MHERSLVRSLLRQVEDVMDQHAGSRATAVRVSVGMFSGVEPALVRSAFDELVNVTVMRGAELELHEVPLEAQCRACGCEFAVERFRFECSQCGGRDVAVVRGEGLVLESVTLERWGQEPEA